MKNSISQAFAKAFFSIPLLFTLWIGTLSSIAHGNTTITDWGISKTSDGGRWIYLRKKSALSVELIFQAGQEPKILRVRPHLKFPQVDIITFIAGEFGTSTNSRETYALLFNNGSQKFLYSKSGSWYFPVSSSDTAAPGHGAQPRWENDASHILISDPEGGPQEVIPVE